MNFLNPAVLFGLIAASIPVILHLLNLRKLKRVEFSTLAFLKQIQKSKIRRIKIKQWILLALRLLIIALLVLAFARPTLDSDALGAISSSAKTHAFYIVDNSASMSVIEGEGSQFNKGKQVVNGLNGLLKEGDNANLFFASDRIQKGNNFESIGDIGNRLKDSKVSSVKPVISNLLYEVVQRAFKSDRLNKEIYLISDFQKSSFDLQEDVPSPANFSDNNNSIFLINLKPDNVFNISVQSLKTQSRIFEKGKTVLFSAKVKNHSDRGVKNLLASIFINGKRSAQNSVDLNPGETKSIEFETVISETGLNEVMLEIDEDDILHDNRRYFGFYVPEILNVLLLTDSPGDGKFIEFALSGRVEKNALNIEQINLSRINSVLIDDYDAVIIAGSENINNYDAVERFTDAGIGILFFPGDNSTLENYVKIAGELGINRIRDLVYTGSNTGNGIEKVDFNHPLFEGIYRTDNTERIDSPELTKYIKILQSTNYSSLITLLDGSVFAGIGKTNNSEIIFFNSAPVLSWSDFPLKGLFVPLVNRSVLYLSSGKFNSDSKLAGNILQINGSGINSPSLRVVKPDGTEEIINLKDFETGKKSINYNNTEETGIYKFYSGNELTGFGVINTNPDESITEYYTSQEVKTKIKELGYNGNIIEIDAAGDVREEIRSARFGSELWRLFLIIALILAFIEMMLARNSKKDLTNFEQG